MLTIDMAIFLPFLAAIIIPFFYKYIRIHVGWFVLLIPIILFVNLARFVPQIANGQTYIHETEWIPSFNINFITSVDGLSMIFGLLITGIGALVVLYSIYYLSKEEALAHFYIYLLLFMGSMLGVVFTDHLMILYVFWELTSIASFLLIAFWYQRKGSRYGAKKSLLITIFGGLGMLIGFLMLHVLTETYSIREIIMSIDQYKEDHLFIAAMVLILLGAFTKSAQFPFHIWLPDAMEAPTPVSAYLHSATMVKAGIYLVARFTPIFGGQSIWFWLVSSIGLLTLFWGAFTAIRQTDLKALLAYSTVSQLGLVMTLFGISSLPLHPDVNIEISFYTFAAFAALFHLVNHSTFKGALFMVIGIIDYRVGTRDIRRLGGLMALMPITFTIAIIGSFSMAGLPPFNGFLSKEMFFTAVLQVKDFDVFSLQTFGIIFPVVAWIASVFTFIYSMIIIFQTFFGPYQEENLGETEEASFGMLIAPLILASLIIGIFFFPNVLGEYILQPALYSMYPEGAVVQHTIMTWHGFNTELMMTLGIIVIGSLLYIFRDYWKKIYYLFPRKWSLDALYNQMLMQTDKIAHSFTSFYMTGYLRHYLLYIYTFFILTMGGLFVYNKLFSFNIRNNSPIGIFEWILATTIVIAGITMILAKSRLTAILINGYIGFSIAMFFVIFRAPDLALTQLVVETVTTALFLLCFYFLPKWGKEKINHKVKGINIVISIAVGLTFTCTALAVKNDRLFESISVYFEDAYELAGGKNIVNTILGDFRAFDTMLEVVVLFIAGIGVYTLIKSKSKKGAKKLEDQ